MNFEKQEAEVTRNYEVFVKLLPGILEDHADQFALMHGGAIVGYFDTAGDAYKAGRLKYQDGVFSIQEVTSRVEDLGYFSHVAGA